MKQGAQIKIAVFLTVFCLVIVLYLQGQSIIQPSISAFSWIITVVSAALFVWERWVWHWKWLYPLSNRPDLRGTWKAEVNSIWNNPETGEPQGTVDVYLVFRQTFSTLNVRLFSAQSDSVSLSASVITDDENVYSVAVTYFNTPAIEHLPHSPIHHGGMLLNIRGGQYVSQMDGKYWTDRRSTGSISMKRHSAKVAHGFDDAKKLSFAARLR